MKKIIMAVIAAAVSSGAVNAAELGNISAKDVVKMAQEARTAIPEPQKSITTDKATKAAKPITAAVDFKSPAFAELLINSLNVKPKLLLTAGGQSYMYKVGEGLTCYKSIGTDIHTPNVPQKTGYYCSINPAGGWKAMGMESYGAGDNREFSLALYAALKVKETNDEGMKTKGLELERPDGDGGTERNQMYCIKPSAEMEAMGFRPTCQFLNAL
ncbi:MAG: hypothetical protein Q7R35_03165 [Elusimicrobiota bacterium]|nr:hypothetical protein [Elusimicrobiota bacterium]